MNLTDEIERLHTLHAQGALTDDEFAQAKAVLLAQLSDASHSPDSDQLRQQLADLQLQNELHQLESDWNRERETYMVRGRYGSRYIPSEEMSVLGGLFIVGFGLFWTSSAVSMGAPGFFPLFGILFILAGVATSAYSFNKARTYKEAEQRYQRRRRKLASQRGSSKSQLFD